ncbi:MAG TPA: ATP-binding cassette domain-containing protein [Candidatus Competibacteraceae bacterium]|nr:ATP-binding cassette domain-containing protein [Candidatus Competibacteraceae bacterium]
MLRGVGYRVNGKVLLADISFTLQAGGASFILGPNGAGKSLLLRLCHGLLVPSGGEIRWQGPAAAEAPRHQTMVLQHPVLLSRSVAANVDYALRLRGLPRALRHARVAEALQRVGLLPLARRPARVLSGGEKQRLALARAWALRPQVLFLDEPTASLDPAATRAVEEVIRDIRDQGIKVVMTSHDLAQARRLADEVLFLHHGRLLEQAAAQAFFSEPRSAEGRAFLRGELLW